MKNNILFLVLFVPFFSISQENTDNVMRKVPPESCSQTISPENSDIAMGCCAVCCSPACLCELDTSTTLGS